MELKKIPQEITKKILIEMYLYQFTEKQIRSNINLIIRDNRKNEPLYKNLIASGGSPCVQKIRDKEFFEFMETYGFPKGYAKSEKIIL